MPNVGEVLTDLLIGRGWTRYRLAKAVGIDQGSVARWVSGSRMVAKSVDAVVSAMELSLADACRLHAANGTVTADLRGALRNPRVMEKLCRAVEKIREKTEEGEE